jgi:hypothetical protein
LSGRLTVLVETNFAEQLGQIRRSKFGALLMDISQLEILVKTYVKPVSIEPTSKPPSVQACMTPLVTTSKNLRSFFQFQTFNVTSIDFLFCECLSGTLPPQSLGCGE